MPSGLNATFMMNAVWPTSGSRTGCQRPLAERDTGIHQRVGGLPQRSGCGVTALSRKAEGECGIGLADVAGCRRHAERNRLVALAHSFFPLYPCDRSRSDSSDGEQNQTDDRDAAQAPEAALLTPILTGQFVFGLAMDRGGQVGDLLTEQRRGRIPRRITGDVDVQRFGRQDATLCQHRQRRIRTIRIKPLGGFIPGNLAACHHEQQPLRPTLAQANSRPPC